MSNLFWPTHRAMQVSKLWLQNCACLCTHCSQMHVSILCFVPTYLKYSSATQKHNHHSQGTWAAREHATFRLYDLHKDSGETKFSAQLVKPTTLLMYLCDTVVHLKCSVDQCAKLNSSIPTKVNVFVLVWGSGEYLNEINQTTGCEKYTQVLKALNETMFIHFCSSVPVKKEASNCLLNIDRILLVKFYFNGFQLALFNSVFHYWLLSELLCCCTRRHDKQLLSWSSLFDLVMNFSYMQCRAIEEVALNCPSSCKQLR